jgi:hypothetical protein
MSIRRTRVLLVTAAGATVALAGAIAVLVALSPPGHPSGNPASPGDGASGAASAPPGMVAASALPTMTASVPGPPVPGVSGDRYAHGVTAGATCSPVGALGFTAQTKVLQCSSTAADPHPRWRAP